MAEYGISKTVDLSYEGALARVREALQEQGFGVLTEIDVKGTLKKKLQVDFRRYVILGVCNPSLAHRALMAEIKVGLLLPCNVVVYETDDGKTVVSALDPVVALGIIENETLRETAEEAAVLLRRAIDSL